MADVSFENVKALRGSTGAGINLCKEALEQAGGDMEKAMDYVRKKGAVKAEKRADKEVNEGVIGVYLHGVDQRTASLVELNCETDFVARNEEFRTLAHDLAMQVAAMCPKYVNKESVPEDIVKKEKSVIKDSDKLKGKPAKIIEKILEGKISKFYEECCLMEQTYFKDDTLLVKDLINEMVAKLGEKIIVGQIFRMSVGMESN